MSNNSNRKHYYDDDAVLRSLRQSRGKELRQDVFRLLYQDLRHHALVRSLPVQAKHWSEGWASLVEWSKERQSGSGLKQPLAIWLFGFVLGSFSKQQLTSLRYTYQYLPKKVLVTLLPNSSTVREAVAAIYRKPSLQLLRKLYQQMEHFVEDVYNEAIVALFKSLPKDKDGQKASLFTYFMGVSRMICRRFAQRQQRQPQASTREEEWEQLLKQQDHSEDIKEEDFSDVLLECRPLIVQQFSFENEGELVQQLLAMMQKNYREVITMKYLQGKDYKEISEQLGINEQNARTKVSRGIAQLRRLLKLNQNENQ